MFDNSNSLFLLLSLLLQDKKAELGMWEDVIKWFQILNLHEVCKSQIKKVEDVESFWDDLLDSIQDENTGK